MMLVRQRVGVRLVLHAVADDCGRRYYYLPPEHDYLA